MAYCKFCNVIIESPSFLTDHDTGKKHKKLTDGYVGEFYEIHDRADIPIIKRNFVTKKQENEEQDKHFEMWASRVAKKKKR